MSKKQPKLTKWFPGDVKPARVGYYETSLCEGDRTPSDFLWWWDGLQWLSHPGKWQCVYQDRSWRGLAQKPN